MPNDGIHQKSTYGITVYLCEHKCFFRNISALCTHFSEFQTPIDFFCKCSDRKVDRKPDGKIDDGKDCGKDEEDGPFKRDPTIQDIAEGVCKE